MVMDILDLNVLLEKIRDKILRGERPADIDITLDLARDLAKVDAPVSEIEETIFTLVEKLKSMGGKGSLKISTAS